MKRHTSANESRQDAFHVDSGARNVTNVGRSARAVLEIISSARGPWMQDSNIGQQT